MSAYAANDEHLTELALRARGGDREAAARFVALTQRDVIRFAAHLAGAQEADDLAQETFIRAMKALASFEGRSSARTWLLSITRHTVLDFVRAQARRPRRADVDDPEAVCDAARADEAHRFDEHVMLQRLIAGLDPQRREAFVATQLVGLSYEEAAAVIGCPVGTIRSRVARARADLAQAMADNGDTPRRHLRAV